MENLVALASRVEGHTRRLKSGKSIHVNGYDRQGMPNVDDKDMTPEFKESVWQNVTPSKVTGQDGDLIEILLGGKKDASGWAEIPKVFRGLLRLLNGNPYILIYGSPIRIPNVISWRKIAK